MPREHTQGIRRYARWSLLFASTGAVLILVAVSTARESYQGWKVDQEIQGLRAQAEALEGRKNNLSSMLARLQSPDTVDQQARMRLGVQKPGEQVFILQAGQNTQAFAITQNMASEVPSVDISNPQKWINYFFHPSL